MYTPEDVKKAVACFRYDWRYDGEAFSYHSKYENSTIEELSAKILTKRTLVDRYIYWSGACRSLRGVGVSLTIADFRHYRDGEIATAAQPFLLTVFTELANGNVSQKLEDYL